MTRTGVREELAAFAVEPQNSAASRRAAGTAGVSRGSESGGLSQIGRQCDPWYSFMQSRRLVAVSRTFRGRPIARRRSLTM